MESQNYLILVMQMLGSLALLMYGMKTMSDALQKMAGPQLRHVLGAMTTNRFTGMLTGILVTAAVQSSTRHYRHDRLVCISGTTHTGTGYFCHYGCQHRYHAHSMDYVGRFLV